MEKINLSSAKSYKILNLLLGQKYKSRAGADLELSLVGEPLECLASLNIDHFKVLFVFC